MREQLHEIIWNGQSISLAYKEWGDRANLKTLTCVHGLTRNAHDFDYLADSLQSDYRIIAIDVVGRGRSSWLTNKLDYHIGNYAQHILLLLQHLQVTKTNWLGTSMGALIGMVVNSINPALMQKYIINDIGPAIPRASLQRIVAYASNKPKFLNLEHAKGYFKKNYSSFGITQEAHWQHLAQYSTRADGGDGLVLHYDPGIVEPFKAALEQNIEINLWPLWDLVKCPTLILRGANSDVLMPDTLVQMKQNHPLVQSIEIPGCGHAPALMEQVQIDMIRNFLNEA